MVFKEYLYILYDSKYLINAKFQLFSKFLKKKKKRQILWMKMVIHNIQVKLINVWFVLRSNQVNKLWKRVIGKESCILSIQFSRNLGKSYCLLFYCQLLYIINKMQLLTKIKFKILIFFSRKISFSYTVAFPTRNKIK